MALCGHLWPVNRPIHLVDLIYGNGVFLTLRLEPDESADGWEILASPDGRVWKGTGVRHWPALEAQLGAAWVFGFYGGQFVRSHSFLRDSGMSGETSRLQSQFWTSTDGERWDKSWLYDASEIYGMAESNGLILLIGRSSPPISRTEAALFEATTSDWATWKNRFLGGDYFDLLHGYDSNTAAPRYRSQVVAGRGVFVANLPPGSGFRFILFQQDGRRIGSLLRPEAVVYAVGYFVGVGQQIFTSAYGRHWTVRYERSGPAKPLLKVAYGNGRFVAASEEELLQSGPICHLAIVPGNGLQLRLEGTRGATYEIRGMDLDRHTQSKKS